MLEPGRNAIKIRLLKSQRGTCGRVTLTRYLICIELLITIDCQYQRIYDMCNGYFSGRYLDCTFSI